jgi:hypothetical protein
MTRRKRPVAAMMVGIVVLRGCHHGSGGRASLGFLCGWLVG